MSSDSTRMRVASASHRRASDSKARLCSCARSRSESESSSCRWRNSRPSARSLRRLGSNTEGTTPAPRSESDVRDQSIVSVDFPELARGEVVISVVRRTALAVDSQPSINSNFNRDVVIGRDNPDN